MSLVNILYGGVYDAMGTHAEHSILKFYFSRFVYMDANWGGYGISGGGLHGAIMPHIELTFGYTAHRISRRYYSSICTAPLRRNILSRQYTMGAEHRAHIQTYLHVRVYICSARTAEQRNGKKEIEFGEPKV